MTTYIMIKDVNLRVFY